MGAEVLHVAEAAHVCRPEPDAHPFERAHGRTYLPADSISRCDCGQYWRVVDKDGTDGFAAPRRWVECSRRRAERIVRKAGR